MSNVTLLEITSRLKCFLMPRLTIDMFRVILCSFFVLPYNIHVHIRKQRHFKSIDEKTKKRLQLPPTVGPTKSDSDVIICLQLLSKALTCALH